MPQRPPRYRPHSSRPPDRPAADPAEPTRPRAAHDDRPSAHARGYDRRWRRARAAFLQLHPLCADCEQRGLVTVATVVDHVRPHKGDQDLFWDETNWQPLCGPCHSTKTAREDGGFGNRQRQARGKR